LPSKEMMVEFLGGPLDGHFDIIRGDENEPPEKLKFRATKDHPPLRYYFSNHGNGKQCVYIYKPMWESRWNDLLNKLEFKVCDDLGLDWGEDEEEMTDQPIDYETVTVHDDQQVVVTRSIDAVLHEVDKSLSDAYVWGCKICKRSAFDWEDTLDEALEDFKAHLAKDHK